LVAHVFGRQALPMVWDFAEANPFSDSGGNFLKNHDFVVKVILNSPIGATPGIAQQINATAPSTYSGEIISTDPPYYDNIVYADLSDFFYVWLRRSLREVYPDLLSTMLTPKDEELIASPYRHEGDRQKAAEFFETGLGQAIAQWRGRGHSDYPTTIFYAFKQAETDKHGTASTGWETFLRGIIDHGFTITGTRPVRSERPTGMKSVVNALASSVVLACVPCHAVRLRRVA
jgi:putative DNA methylase